MKEKSPYQLKTSRNQLKYNCLAIALFLLLAINCFGQSITWQRTYDGIDGVADGGYSVCKADGDNFYICGYTTFLPNIRRVYIIKINQYGDTIWTKSIPISNDSLEGECRTAISTSENGCVLTGSSTNLFTIKVSYEGEIIWNKTYELYAKQLYEIINTTDGGYIACGRDYEDINDNAFLLKIDSIGNLQWHKTFYSTYWKNFDCITETNNNDGYLIGGFNKNFQIDTSKAILLKVNYSGDSLWQKQYELNIISNVESINKISTGYLIGSTNLIENTVNYSILKVNEIGEILFQKSISSTNNLLILNDLKIINSNKYVIAGRYGSIGHIFIVDSNGIMLGEEFYNSPDFLTIRSILPISNGDILFAGAVDFDSVSTKRDVYALRTDSLLNAPPPIGVINMNNNIPKYFKLFQNYPNPFNPVTNIKYEIPKDVNVSVKFFDILGREVFSFNEYKKAGSYEVQFDGSNFASGMYFYKMVVGELRNKSGNTNNGEIFTDTKKMVLLK